MSRKLLDKPAKPQIDRFKEAARALGCDEDEAAFDEKLKEIARQKVKSGTALPTSPTEND